MRAAAAVLLLLVGLTLGVCSTIDEDRILEKTCEDYARGEAPADCIHADAMVDPEDGLVENWLFLALALLALAGGVYLFVRKEDADEKQVPASERLTVCPECRRTVSRAAGTCPHCNAPITPRHW